MQVANQFRHVVFPRYSYGRQVRDLARSDEPDHGVVHPERNLPRDAAGFVEWLFGQAGLDARAYRAETLARRLSACLRMLRAGSLAQARALLESDRTLMDSAVSTMLVGVTSFFRDPAVFDALRQKVVLPLLDRGSKEAGARDASIEKKGIYAWSIGCSDGAELYSLALILAEINALSSSYLLGTDCRPDAIERAKAAVYDASSLREVPEPMLKRWFEGDGSDWRLVAPLRHSTRWRVANVLEVREPGLWDLILFRNTSMYFRSDLGQRLWHDLEAWLRPGGVLVLGRAERPLGAQRLSMVAPCIYRRIRR